MAVLPLRSPTEPGPTLARASGRRVGRHPPPRSSKTSPSNEKRDPPSTVSIDRKSLVIKDPNKVLVVATFSRQENQAPQSKVRTHARNLPSLDARSVDRLVARHRFVAPTLEQFPVVVMARNRPEMLRMCLESLLAARRANPRLVTVYQHGGDAGVRGVAESFAARGVQRVQDDNQPRGESHVRIAHHYKFALSHAFRAHPAASGLIIVEDDMIFSPDFFDYFAATARLYDVDPTVYCISTWNDNGFRGRVRDSRRLLRSEFFMGLGWLINRRIFEKELEPRWPRQHWDHWMRDPRVRKGRECVYPEVPRNYNKGSRGAHVNDEFYRKFLEPIAYHTNASRADRVTPRDAVRATRGAFDAETSLLFARADCSARFSDLKRHRNGVFAFSFDAARAKHAGQTEYETQPHDHWARLAGAFGIWHEFRTIRKGLIRFWWEGNYLLLVRAGSESARELAKGGCEPRRLLLDDMQGVASDPDKIVLAKRAQSCDAACAAVDLRCSPLHLRTLNNCESLQKYFRCGACEASGGPDLPAMVVSGSAPNYGRCLTNTHAFTCHGTHKITRRICPCV